MQSLFCVFLIRSGEQENKVHILRGTVEQRQFRGKGTKENIFLILGKQGPSQFISEDQVSRCPLGGPQNLTVQN